MKLISLFAAAMISAAFAPTTSHAQTTPRDAIGACTVQADYAESLQNLRWQYPHFTKKIAKEVVKGETPNPAQRKVADATVDRVFAFPRTAHPSTVANHIGRNCTKAAHEALPK